jgi:hypothetical protein
VRLKSRASVSSWLVRLNGRAVSTELECLAARVFELGAHVHVDQVAGLDALEAVPFKSVCVLCLQQSAGYSARPEVDVAAAFLAERILDRYVGDLDPPAVDEHLGIAEKQSISRGGGCLCGTNPPEWQ